MIPYTARKEFQLPLFTGINQIWEYINQPASNPLLHISDGPYIYDIQSFNEEVVREAVLNAISHRSFQIQSDVVIKQYPDKLIITNAGGFPIGVDINNILTTNSVPRSKRMSEVLQKTGLVERSGQGVDKMFYNCIMEGKSLPDYSGTDAYQVSLTLESTIEDEAFLLFIRREQANRDNAKKLNVFDLLTLYKVRKGDHSLDITIIDKLLKENLIVSTKGNYELPSSYFQLKKKRVTDQVTDQVKALLKAIDNQRLSVKEIMDKLSLSHRPTFRANYLNPALEKGYIVLTYPDQPNHPKQKYYLTEKGKALLK